MAADPHKPWPAVEPPLHDEPIWHALRPESRSAGLKWSDLKLLAERRQLRGDDYVWNPGWDGWRLAGDVPGLVREQEPPTARAEHQHAQPATLKDRARHEFYSYIIITIYIWLIITLLRLHQDLLAETYHLNLQSQGRAIITALILGKVVLVAEALRLGNFIGARLPALSVIIRSVLFAGAILIFHACEEAVMTVWNGQSLTVAMKEVTAETLRRTVLLASIMTIALIPYFLIKEIEKRTGQSNLLLVAVGLKR